MFVRGLLILLFFIMIFPIYAQDEAVEIETQDITEETDTADASGENEEAETAEGRTLRKTPAEEEYTGPLTKGERQRIELELKSSTLGELAVWCRMLGLSEGGTREELYARIRGHFEMPSPKGEEAGKKQKIITIETADTNKKFTISVIDEDYAILKGNVYMTLKDGESIHRIKADEILFNSTRNILTARGGVVYEKVSPDKTETFRGENITVNIDNWSSTFLDGSSTMESDGTAYLFSGTVISRTDQDVTILNNAKISSTFDDEAYWSISASKLWLLPGSDFAILNAVLNVGEIPVLYIPFFFFPTDPLVFHPVIGFKTREGGFIQTTTYILGQPKANTAQASSLSKILGNSNDMQLEREGLFLRSTGKKVVNPNEISLRAMLDYYVNLGTYIGFELTTPKTGILNQMNLTLGIGFTRTISFVNNQYTPYAPNFDGTFENNHSNLFTLEVPFRYRMKFDSSISGSVGTLSWNFPYYSDPYVDRDFLNRAESMDWVKMLQEGAAAEEITTPDTEIQPYIWTMSGNINQSFTALAPYISRMALSTISTTLSFKRLGDSMGFSPNRFFFAPDKWTIVNLSGSINGSPLSLGGTPAAVSAAKTAFTLPDDPLIGIGVPISPWPDAPGKEEKISSIDTIIPPVLGQKFSLPSAGNFRFNIDYQFTPTFFSEMQFMNALSNNTDRWKTYEDVDWAVQSVLGNFGMSGSMNIRADHSSNVIRNTFTITGNSVWRDYFDINEEYFTDDKGVVDNEKMEQVRRSQFSQTNYTSSYSYNGSLEPLKFSQVFKSTSLVYNFSGTLVRSKRYNIDEGSPKDGPELRPQWGSWEKEETKDGKFIPGLNKHSLSANILANVLEQTQTIRFTAELPPLDERYIINPDFRFKLWISETNIRTTMETLTKQTLSQTLKDKGKEEGDWWYRPIDISETLKFSDKANLFVGMKIDPEEKFEFTEVNSTLTLWEFRIRFLANKIIKSEFYAPDDPYVGSWRPVPDAKPELLPRNLDFSYYKSFDNIEIIRNWVGLNFSVNTTATFNLLEYTNSNFEIALSANFRVAGFLDLTLTATSYNKVIWRYFKDVPGMEDYTTMYIDGPQNNLFTDLFDSFNFSDTAKRENSGFKMRNFNINATHHLGDWTASIGIQMYQYNDTSVFPPKFKVVSDLSFLVQWKPITEIKSNINFDGKKEKWTVE